MNNSRDFLTEIIYPDGIERSAVGKVPAKQPDKITKGAYRLSSAILSLVRAGYKIEKINMDGLKPPYILLANHMQFMDFAMLFRATYPHKVNVVAAFNVFHLFPKIMEKAGCICTHKFTTDTALVRSCKKVLKEYGDVFCMYPEARYTPDGTQSVLPDAIGKLVKKNGVPLVVMLNHGNYLNLPFWADYTYRKSPFNATVKQVLTAEQVESMTVDEINAVIREEMTYDDFKWQKDNNIIIKHKKRAEGLHKVLYQCPACNTEHKMNTKGIHLFCEECGKKWEMTTLGELKALNGETEFSHIPDWYAWERQNVRDELLQGKYHYEEEVEIISQPNVNDYVPLGKGKVTHDLENGFVIEGHYNGHDYKIERPTKGLYSLHIEYGFNQLKGADCFEISTTNDSFYCMTKKKDIVTKLALATEEAFKIANEQ